MQELLFLYWPRCRDPASCQDLSSEEFSKKKNTLSWGLADDGTDYWIVHYCLFFLMLTIQLGIFRWLCHDGSFEVFFCHFAGVVRNSFKSKNGALVRTKDFCLRWMQTIFYERRVEWYLSDFGCWQLFQKKMISWVRLVEYSTAASNVKCIWTVSISRTDE